MKRTQPTESQAEVAAPPVETLESGNVFVIFASDSQKPETFERVQIKAGDRTVRVSHGGALYDHVDDAPDGTWIYMPMAR